MFLFTNSGFSLKWMEQIPNLLTCLLLRPDIEIQIEWRKYQSPVCVCRWQRLNICMYHSTHWLLITNFKLMATTAHVRSPYGPKPVLWFWGRIRYRLVHVIISRSGITGHCKYRKYSIILQLVSEASKWVGMALPVSVLLPICHTLRSALKKPPNFTLEGTHHLGATLFQGVSIFKARNFR